MVPARLATKALALAGLLLLAGNANAGALTEDAAALPVSFGPSSAPHILAILEVLKRFQAAPATLAGLWGAPVIEFESATEAFLTAVNERDVTMSTVEALVRAWLAHSTKQGQAEEFVAEILSEGLPVVGRRDQSKVIGARQAKKWTKATKKVRAAFKTVEEYRDGMLGMLFGYLPFVMHHLSITDVPEAFAAAKKPKAGQLVAYSTNTKRYTLVADGDEQGLAGDPSVLWPKDHMDLLRYVGFYLCRETTPPTFLPRFSNVLSGWEYGTREEHVLTALHYPAFEEQLQVLAEEQAEDAENELLRIQVAIYREYLEARSHEYSEFIEEKNSEHGKEVRVGGAGRVSAEVARDLSKMHGVKTFAVDHRHGGQEQDIFAGGGLKKAYANFVKELAKDKAHLPTFGSSQVAEHYRQIHGHLAESANPDPKVLANLERVLRANGETGLPDAPDGEGPLKLSANFNVVFGERGEGELVFAQPEHYDAYEPSAMDDKVVENLATMIGTIAEATTAGRQRGQGQGHRHSEL